MRTLKLLFCAVWLGFLTVACGGDPGEREGPKGDQSASGSAEELGNPRVPVEALVVRRMAVRQTLPLTGVVKPVHSVDIVTEVQGEVVRILGELGDAVSPDDTLAVIDDEIPLSEYRQARSQVLSAENNLKIAELNYKSDRELLENNDISRLAFENSQLAVKTAEANLLSALAHLSSAEKRYRDTRVVSPIAGLIARKYIDLGTMVTPNMPVYRVVDLSSIKVELGVPQSAVSHVRVGDSAEVSVAALDGQTFEGSVRFISPLADERSGAFPVEIHVTNTADRAIRAGMTVRIDLVLTDIRKQLAVPDYAVVVRDGGNYVYRVSGGTARLTEISVGETFGSSVIVNGGVTEGDTIVVVGMKNLGVETKVWVEVVH
jgi:RND family efflux transporter MFP subunit